MTAIPTVTPTVDETEKTQQPAQSPKDDANTTPAGDQERTEDSFRMAIAVLGELADERSCKINESQQQIVEDVVRGAKMHANIDCFLPRNMRNLRAHPAKGAMLQIVNDLRTRGASSVQLYEVGANEADDAIGDVWRNKRNNSDWMADTSKKGLGKILRTLSENPDWLCVVLPFDRTQRNKDRQAYIKNGLMVLVLPRSSDSVKPDEQSAPAPADAPPLAKVAEKAVETGAVVQHEQIEDA